jgi:hypothetical protein
MKRDNKKLIALATMGLLTSSCISVYADDIDTTRLNLNKAIIQDNKVTIPSAMISGDKPINGMKLYFSTGYSKSKPMISYKLHGKTYTTSNQQIHINETLTANQATSLLQSIVISRTNDNSFQFTVRLNSADTNSEDVIYNPQNGHHYKFIPASNMNWDEAKKQAEKQLYQGTKGYLVTITSADELDFFNSITPKSVWLGLTDEEVEGEWKWVTGEKYDYTNWAVDEPNNNGGSEHYVQSLPGTDGEWNDLPITGSALRPVEGYIAEFPTKNHEVAIQTSEEETITIDNKAPHIENIPDMSIIQGESIDVMKDVVAIDDVDGKSPVKVSFINPNGDKVDKLDSNLLGDWKVVYTSTDDSTNLSKEITNLVVKEPPKTITITPKKEADRIILDWNKIKNVNRYKVFRRIKEETDFKQIKDTTENTINDDSAIDISAPSIPNVVLDTSKEVGSNIYKIVVNSKDIGTTYEYKVNTENSKGIITNTSIINEVNIESGLEGYQYKITNDAYVDLSKEPIVSSDDIILKEDDNNSKLHIRSIDKQGNVSKEFVYPISFAIAQPDEKPVVVPPDEKPTEPETSEPIDKEDDDKPVIVPPDKKPVEPETTDSTDKADGDKPVIVPPDKKPVEPETTDSTDKADGDKPVIVPPDKKPVEPETTDSTDKADEGKPVVVPPDDKPTESEITQPTDKGGLVVVSADKKTTGSETTNKAYVVPISKKPVKMETKIAGYVTNIEITDTNANKDGMQNIATAFKNNEPIKIDTSKQVNSKVKKESAPKEKRLNTSLQNKNTKAKEKSSKTSVIKSVIGVGAGLGLLNYMIGYIKSKKNTLILIVSDENEENTLVLKAKNTNSEILEKALESKSKTDNEKAISVFDLISLKTLPNCLKFIAYSGKFKKGEEADLIDYFTKKSNSMNKAVMYEHSDSISVKVINNIAQSDIILNNKPINTTISNGLNKGDKIKIEDKESSISIGFTIEGIAKKNKK